MFLGAWRVWSHYAWRTGRTLPVIKTVAFLKMYHKAEAPSGSNAGHFWEDGPGANKWFTEKFLYVHPVDRPRHSLCIYSPGVTIESRREWEERDQSGKIFLIPLAVVADRRGGHSGPSNAWKPWGDVLRLPVSPNWLTNLRERVLQGYDGPVSLRRAPKPRILYLERQGSGRSLTDEDHEALIWALLKVEEEGLAEVIVERFGSHIPFEDQVAKISTVDVRLLIPSAHGGADAWVDSGIRPRQRSHACALDEPWNPCL